MKKSRPGKGTEQRSIKGLFKMSRGAQDRFQELLFPSKPQTPAMRALHAAIVALAVRTDRWLASRAPA